MLKALNISLFYFNPGFVSRDIIHINTSVKIIVAPVGMLRYHEATSPASIPMKPANIEIMIIFLKFFVNRMATLGGIVRSERTSTTPAILIFNTITSDTRVIRSYFKRSTLPEKVLA
jgi:hypothetical protein